MTVTDSSAANAVLSHKCSVVIPSCNAGGFVIECVRSCLAQEDVDLEVIVVDDGSTDGSIEAMKEAIDDPRLKTIHQKNSGVGAARNAGLAACSGEFVNFVDADDLLEPRKLAKQSRILARNPDMALVLCDGVMIDHAGVVVDEYILHRHRFSGPANLFDLLFSTGQFPPVVPLVRKQAVEGVGGFENDREFAGWADTYLWLQISLKHPSYHWIGDKLCRYRVHDGSMSGDTNGMELAAKRVYEALMRQHPGASAEALRFLQERFGDLEHANHILRRRVAELEANRKRVAAAESSLRQREHALSSRELQSRALILEGRLGRVLRTLAATNRKLVIWGAGSGGRRVNRVVASLAGAVHAFADMDTAKSGREIDGIKIVHTSSLADGEFSGAFVLIASTHAREIRDSLEEMGRGDQVDFLELDFTDVAAWEHDAGA